MENSSLQQRKKNLSPTGKGKGRRGGEIACPGGRAGRAAARGDASTAAPSGPMEVVATFHGYGLWRQTPAAQMRAPSIERLARAGRNRAFLTLFTACQTLLVLAN